MVVPETYHTQGRLWVAMSGPERTPGQSRTHDSVEMTRRAVVVRMVDR
jgi:hypothetical protein